MHKIIGAALALLIFVSPVALSQELHSKDPRNPTSKVGVEVDEKGELKFIVGGGDTNWYEGSENQGVFQLDYKMDSNDGRFRFANFDSRFGGVYGDFIYTDDVSLMSTIGYILPITANNSKTQFFPSLNYSYLDFDKKNPIRAMVPDELGGGNHSQLSSLNLYILHPWDDTHFTFIEMFGGRSFSGVEIEIYDVCWTQGMNSTILGKAAFVYFKGQYSRTEVSGSFAPGGSDNSDDAKFSFGVELKF
ncbi:hypothetical protein SAMN04488540_103146 [Ferrimonas sediminum]|uniref:Nucleoside-specific outer membrane channel protein Tsx n=1 Tax=Ferrimonas sediminum TaxID=718193 RepID=A0A1G8NLB8_9GAMM|nr:hypothetical protein [Ferrimonas sediminum]SDI80310.1 hypothetical protein SAMN04488540_103146 [Ferrimonas sediminum]